MPLNAGFALLLSGGLGVMRGEIKVRVCVHCLSVNILSPNSTLAVTTTHLTCTHTVSHNTTEEDSSQLPKRLVKKSL